MTFGGSHIDLVTLRTEAVYYGWLKGWKHVQNQEQNAPQDDQFYMLPGLTLQLHEPPSHTTSPHFVHHAVRHLQVPPLKLQLVSLPLLHEYITASKPAHLRSCFYGLCKGYVLSSKITTRKYMKVFTHDYYNRASVKLAFLCLSWQKYQQKFGGSQTLAFGCQWKKERVMSR
jgi:hypothetical protein